MKCFLLVLLLFFEACAMMKPSSKHPPKESAQNIPGWVYAPYELCQEQEQLCASGEGKGFAEADASARANLASIFEVSIKSELNVSTTSGQSFPWQGAVKEEVQRSLSESVNQLLENVQIKSRFRHQGISYALAALDRAKGSDLLAGRLNKLDQELKTLWGQRQRTSLRRMVKLFLEREKLSERYSIITGQGKLSPVTWEELIRWKSSRPAEEPILLKVGQSPEWLREKLTELLTEAGFRLTKGEAKQMVTLQVDSLKEFLNVNGFEKHTFTLSLSSYNAGEKKRTISTSETVTGRSQADALLKVKEIFTQYIEQHLSDLHLD